MRLLCLIGWHDWCGVMTAVQRTYLGLYCSRCKRVRPNRMQVLAHWTVCSRKGPE